MGLGLGACAPSAGDRHYMLVRYDPDVFASIPPPGGWITVENPSPIRDRPTPGTDCNRNFIDDALDLNGLIARGPYAVGNRPEALAAAGFDDDEYIDLVVANYDDDSLSILWQGSNHIYEDTSRVDVFRFPSCVTTGDFDGDDYNDIAVGKNTIDPPWHHVSVLRNVKVEAAAAGDPDRSFENYGDYPISEDPILDRPVRCITAVDVDNDNDLDLLASSGSERGVHPDGRLSSMVTLMRNRGDGTFDAPEHRFVDLDRPEGLVAVDIDDDDDQDLVVAGGVSGEPVWILENPGTDPRAFPDWTGRSSPSIDHGFGAVAVGDLDGEHGVDLVAVGSRVTVLLHTGLGHNWAASAEYSIGGQAYSVALADLDNDDDLDIAVPVESDDSLAILINQGDGIFAEAEFVPLGNGPRVIVTGDFDRDLRPELAIAHRWSNDVWVLHVRPAPVSEDLNGNGIPDSCEIEAD